MRTEQEIREEIKRLEIQISQLFDKKENTGSIQYFEYATDLIAQKERDIKQFKWVLNE